MAWSRTNLRSLCACGVVLELRIMNGEEGSVITSVFQRMDQTDKGLDCVGTEGRR